MRFYRCYNPDCATNPHGRLGFDFEAEQPTCPKCQTDGNDPLYSQVVISLILMHFELPSKVKLVGTGRVACKPDVNAIGKARFSREPTAVNCKACRATDVFKSASKDATIDLAHDFEAEVDLKEGVIRTKG